VEERDFELLSTLEMTRNITRTADLLYVSQSALSKRINAIEQELGITLLVRSRQGVHFTPEGEEVLKRTAEAAYQLKLLRETLEAGRDTICGTLNAGVSINYAMYRLPELLVEYLSRFPKVNTHITTDQSRKLFSQLLDAKIDLAILRGEYPWPGNRLLVETDAICIIRHDKDRGKSLNEIPYIGRKTDQVFEREIARWMRENEVQPGSRGLYVDNITTCVELVNRGLGWAIIPEICLGDFKGESQPMTFSDGQPFVRSTYVLYSDSAYALPQVKAFIDTIQSFRK